MRRNRFVSGIVAGSLIGASIGMYAQGRVTSRHKRLFMKSGSKLFKNASNFIEDLDFPRMFK